MNKFHVRTTRHPSGRLTCEIREDKAKLWSDSTTGDLSESDFYRTVSSKLAELGIANQLASYEDMAEKLR